jgi:hypothetical protein
MLIPFGVLSAARAGGVAGDYELISTTVLTGTEATVTFSNLGDYSSTYKHLQIRIVARTDRSGESNDFALLRINGDTGSNYRSHFLYGNGSSVFAGDSASTGILAFRLAAATSTANTFGAIVLDILDPYSTTKNKTVRYLGGSTSLAEIHIGSGARFNTETTNTISLTGGVGSFISGSRFSLYGIKG